MEEPFKLSRDVGICAEVAREFIWGVRTLDLISWPEWHHLASHSPHASFAKHLSRDEAAVRAALEYNWGNGPVEEIVHRLKLIKRSM